LMIEERSKNKKKSENAAPQPENRNRIY
jgi:hypothetical protein